MPWEASRCATPYGSRTSRVREYTTDAREVFCPCSWLSMTVTSRPRATSETAAVRPVGPAPTTSTSVVVGSIREPPAAVDLADLNDVPVGTARIACVHR
jgi:hypothetical protein